jgi:hypothetical protein
MTRTHPSRATVVAFAILCIATFVPRPAAADTEHLWWAEQLVNHVSRQNNEYNRDPERITWAGVNGSRKYTNRTQCNSFLTNVLQQAYGWTDDDFEEWLGARNPGSVTYYHAIVREDGFDRIFTVDDIAPGDIVAIRYARRAHRHGHVAIVQSAPMPREPTSPVISRTHQFDLRVVDSTESPHGSQDTRKGADTGAGFGVMRLYTNNALRIVGYTWSTSQGSEYRRRSSYPIAIGRLRQ